MTERKIPCHFMRGGTSKALMFRAEDLPDRTEWDDIFTGAMGSPDSYGRQLNGMGGGLSSLSKVCIVGPATRSDADVDYTFAQVAIDEARVDYKGNCGNMSAAVGPFAVESGLVDARGNSATVRIHNTNTSKIIHATFPLADGSVQYEGDLEIPGVSGSGAPIALEFIEPGGASTGKLLPTGEAVQVLDTAFGQVFASCVDAANACVFVEPRMIGLVGTETPLQLEDPDILAKADAIRTAGSVAMGIAPDLAAAKRVSTVPYVALASPPQDFVMLDGSTVTAASHDICIRVFSNGQPHRASPLTIALCTAVAARIHDSIVARQLEPAVAADADRALRLGTPSGVITVSASVEKDAHGGWLAGSGAFFRTARMLFEGHVWAKI